LYQSPGNNSEEISIIIDLIVEQGNLSDILNESAGEVKSLTEALRI
jgi:hypothetical protein